MAEKLNTDFGKFTRDEATELCVYHLRMAATFFQLTPEDGNESLQKEIKRQCEDDPVCDLAAQTWADKIFDMYEQMKERD